MAKAIGHAIVVVDGIDLVVELLQTVWLGIRQSDVNQLSSLGQGRVTFLGLCAEIG